MREGLPSLTAVYVAFARALASFDPDLSAACRDDVAARLLPRAPALLVERARRLPALRAALRKGSLGMVDHLALRTAVIDRAVERAVEQGARQLVVLGAGLDARAYRLPALHDCVVFEVDHPSTQALKLRKAARLTPRARDLRHAACDFETVSLDQALDAQRFDRSLRSVWIWEGVVMYLERPAIEASLRTIAAASTSGSTLIASYVTPRVMAVPTPIGRLGLRGLSLIAEPVHSPMTPADMRELLSRHHFDIRFDALPADVAREHGAVNVLRSVGMPDEHVAIALKS